MNGNYIKRGNQLVDAYSEIATLRTRIAELEAENAELRRLAGKSYNEGYKDGCNTTKRTWARYD